MSFTDQVLESVAPWSDPGGFWDTYNAAIASLFEPVFDIVTDSGDPNQTIVAVLSTSLNAAASVTSLPITRVTQAISAGTEITLIYLTSTQTFTVSSDAHLGDASISVEAAVLNFAYPMGAPVQLAYSPGWSKLLNYLDCPDEFLPYLSQFNGADVPVGLDPATARQKIVAESAQHRGTPLAVKSAVQRNLRGTQSVVILERTDEEGANPYWFLVIVRPEEVIEVQALTDDVNATKPGGVQWTLIQTDGWTIGQMEASFLTIGALEAAFATLGGLENEQLGH